MLVVKDGKDKLVFVHLQKCAGTFVNNLLQRMYPQSYRPFEHKDSTAQMHIPHYELKSLSRIRKLRGLGSLMSFGTIRNPWDYYVSLYSFSKQVSHASWAKGNLYNKLGQPSSFAEFVERLADPNRSIDERSVRRHYGDFFIRMDKLNAGVLTIRYLNMFYKKNVFENSIDYIKDNHEGLISVSRIIKCEDIEGDIYSVLMSSGCKHNALKSRNKFSKFINNKKIKRNESKRQHYREFYTNKLKDTVREKERLIIDKYGYEF